MPFESADRLPSSENSTADRPITAGAVKSGIVLGISTVGGALDELYDARIPLVPGRRTEVASWNHDPPAR